MPPKKKRINVSKFERAKKNYNVPPDMSSIKDPEVCPQTREGRYAWLNAIGQGKIEMPGWFGNMIGLSEESGCSVQLHRDEITIFAKLDVAIPIEDRRRLVLQMGPLIVDKDDNVNMPELAKITKNNWILWAIGYECPQKDVPYIGLTPKVRAYQIAPYDFHEIVMPLEVELPSLAVSMMFGEET